MGGAMNDCLFMYFFNIVPYNQNKMSNWYFPFSAFKDGE